MISDKFRIQHSLLIEHYQFVEAHLESIYAALSGKNLLYGLHDVEKASLPIIIKEIQTLEQRKKVCVFSEDDYDRLKNAVCRRNFWCHNCYYDLVFDRKTGNLKYKADTLQMNNDLLEAEDLRNYLFEKQSRICERNSTNLLGF